jgi:hypothetical protein
VSSRDFCKWFGISEATITRRYEKWSVFCKIAGLSSRYTRKINSKNELFENLDNVWNALGRQPRAKEIKQPLSPISISRYQKELGFNWYKICLEFMSWKSGASADEIERESKGILIGNRHNLTKHKTRREISLSLRYEVLKKDKFRCVKCGRSPATIQGLQLHIDHIEAWAKGGESVKDNLQTLCSDCNLGKSNKSDS